MPKTIEQTSQDLCQTAQNLCQAAQDMAAIFADPSGPASAVTLQNDSQSLTVIGIMRRLGSASPAWMVTGVGNRLALWAELTCLPTGLDADVLDNVIGMTVTDSHGQTWRVAAHCESYGIGDVLIAHVFALSRAQTKGGR
ncbi:MAG: hypothetical protein R3Y11_00485 [Pseudomonadota bacterium]